MERAHHITGSISHFSASSNYCNKYLDILEELAFKESFESVTFDIKTKIIFNFYFCKFISREKKVSRRKSYVLRVDFLENDPPAPEHYLRKIVGIRFYRNLLTNIFGNIIYYTIDFIKNNSF